jgi:hypothetical protein
MVSPHAHRLWEHAQTLIHQAFDDDHDHAEAVQYLVDIVTDECAGAEWPLLRATAEANVDLAVMYGDHTDSCGDDIAEVSRLVWQ